MNIFQRIKRYFSKEKESALEQLIYASFVMNRLNVYYSRTDFNNVMLELSKHDRSAIELPLSDGSDRDQLLSACYILEKYNIYISHKDLITVKL